MVLKNKLKFACVSVNQERKMHDFTPTVGNGHLSAQEGTDGRFRRDRLN